ncbi:uncharacterized protein LOC5518731 isoform X2 [Nematostella vectensis]|uniref:uncharacterized protein LOC5518731 isoform X2 n=1 Tax=Nematostella vectensis TaxID=45351 RepID=UPI0020779353|nr:uncharacterized protein LOC5518731 isoform X2 [Nematostella vectensis]
MLTTSVFIIVAILYPSMEGRHLTRPKISQHKDLNDYSMDKEFARTTKKAEITGELEVNGTRFESMGCWRDAWARALTSLEGEHPLLMDPNYKTRTYAMFKCARAALDKHVTIFGLENGGQCFGTNEGSTKLATYGPSSDCRVNGKGGPWSLQAYRFLSRPAAQDSASLPMADVDTSPLLDESTEAPPRTGPTITTPVKAVEPATIRPQGGALPQTPVKGKQNKRVSDNKEFTHAMQARRPTLAMTTLQWLKKAQHDAIEAKVAAEAQAAFHSAQDPHVQLDEDHPQEHPHLPAAHPVSTGPLPPIHPSQHRPQEHPHLPAAAGRGATVKLTGLQNRQQQLQQIQEQLQRRKQLQKMQEELKHRKLLQEQEELKHRKLLQEQEELKHRKFLQEQEELKHRKLLQEKEDEIKHRKLIQQQEELKQRELLKQQEVKKQQKLLKQQERLKQQEEIRHRQLLKEQEELKHRKLLQEQQKLQHKKLQEEKLKHQKQEEEQQQLQHHKQEEEQLKHQQEQQHKTATLNSHQEHQPDKSLHALPGTLDHQESTQHSQKSKDSPVHTNIKPSVIVNTYNGTKTSARSNIGGPVTPSSAIQMDMPIAEEVVPPPKTTEEISADDKQQDECFCPNKVCDANADLAFVIDGSSDIPQMYFSHVLDYLKALARGFNASQTQVSLMAYGDDATAAFNFGSVNTTSEIDDGIDAVSYMGGEPKTGNALYKAKKGLFEVSSRPGVSHALVLLTSGSASDEIGPPALELRNAGVKVTAIGLGKLANVKELIEIASEPKSSHVFTAFLDTLPERMDEIVTGVCSDVKGNLRERKEPCFCSANKPAKQDETLESSEQEISEKNKPADDKTASEPKKQEHPSSQTDTNQKKQDEESPTVTVTSDGEHTTVKVLDAQSPTPKVTINGKTNDGKSADGNTKSQQNTTYDITSVDPSLSNKLKNLDPQSNEEGKKTENHTQITINKSAKPPATNDSTDGSQISIAQPSTPLVKETGMHITPVNPPQTPNSQQSKQPVNKVENQDNSAEQSGHHTENSNSVQQTKPTIDRTSNSDSKLSKASTDSQSGSEQPIASIEPSKQNTPPANKTEGSPQPEKEKSETGVPKKDNKDGNTDKPAGDLMTNVSASSAHEVNVGILGKSIGGKTIDKKKNDDSDSHNVKSGGEAKTAEVSQSTQKDGSVGSPSSASGGKPQGQDLGQGQEGSEEQKVAEEEAKPPGDDQKQTQERQGQTEQTHGPDPGEVQGQEQGQGQDQSHVQGQEEGHSQDQGQEGTNQVPPQGEKTPISPYDEINQQLQKLQEQLKEEAAQQQRQQQVQQQQQQYQDTVFPNTAAANNWNKEMAPGYGYQNQQSSMSSMQNNYGNSDSSPMYIPAGYEAPELALQAMSGQQSYPTVQPISNQDTFEQTPSMRDQQGFTAEQAQELAGMGANEQQETPIATEMLMSKQPISSSGPTVKREDCSVNLGVVLDSKTTAYSSDDNARKMLQFAKKVTHLFPVSPEGNRVGMMVYSGSPKLKVVHFDHFLDQDTMDKAIDSASYLNMEIKTGKVLNFAQEHLFSRVPAGKQNVLLLITDGVSYDDVTKPAVQLQHKGVEIFCVGVGDNVVRKELETIASSPQSDHVIMTSYNMLEATLEQIKQKVCSSAAKKENTHRASNRMPHDCDQAADIGFLIDGSRTIEVMGKGNFGTIIEFVKNVTKMFPLSRDAFSVGAVVYGSEPSLEIPLGSHNTSKGLLKALSKIKYPGTATKTGKALEYARLNLFGSRNARRKVPKILVVLTKGSSRDDIREASEDLHRDGVHVVSVGMGPVNDRMELANMASLPNKDNIVVSDYSKLSSNVNRLRDIICKATRKQKLDIK